MRDRRAGSDHRCDQEDVAELACRIVTSLVSSSQESLKAKDAVSEENRAKLTETLANYLV
jgi:hypothetical protein